MSTQKTKALRDAVSGDLTGLEDRARRLVERLGAGSERVREAYAEAPATRANHIARLHRLRAQLDKAASALDKHTGAR